MYFYLLLLLFLFIIYHVLLDNESIAMYCVRPTEMSNLSPSEKSTNSNETCLKASLKAS
jgi:hypothetical protein